MMKKIFKVETFEEGLKIPIVQYKLYSGKNRENLDLSICEGIKIDLLIPVSINEDELYKYYLKSEYYNSICFPYTSENGTDIPLKDRQKEFIDNNMTICEENCDFDEYNKRTKKAACKCDIKNFTESFFDINFDMQVFYKYCTNFTKLVNLDVMKCYKILFTKNGMLNNYGSFLILPIILFHIISYVIFNLRDLKLIRNKLREIANFKKIFDSLNQKKNKNKISEIKKYTENNQDNNGNNIQDSNKNFLKERETILAEAKLSITYEKKESKNRNEKNKLKKEQDKVINNTVNSHINKKGKKKKKSKYSINVLKTNDISSNLSSNKLDFSPKSIKYLQKGKIKEKNISFLNKNLEDKPNLPYIAYNNFEMNNLVYEEALKYDKRNFFQYYLSLIKTKHILLFAFHSSDYNSIIIKINLFFFSFALFFTINALFFDDRTMHKIFTDGGKYDLIFQIPKILYSSLISTVINNVVRYFSLSQMNILEIKKKKIVQNLDQKILKVENCLYYKFIIFFRLSFLLLLFFWYYVSCFCVVYRNTQLQLIKDTLIGFSFCLIYPLGLYLLPGIFRFPSLKSSKKNMKYLYKFSVVLQLII